MHIRVPVSTIREKAIDGDLFFQVSNRISTAESVVGEGAWQEEYVLVAVLEIEPDWLKPESGRTPISGYRCQPAVPVI